MAESDERRSNPGSSPFGTLLRRLRDAANLTQEELAEQAGVSARLVSDLERGKILRPRRDTIQMLADALGLTGDDREEFTEVARGRYAGSQPVPATPGPVRYANLPLPPAGIVGREREVTATTSLLHQPEVRLLTLTGTGGVGKTRLALEAASRVAGTFRNGAVFVDLAPVTDTANVIPAIARSLAALDQNDAPPFEQLVAFLQDKQLLIILDNLEHLIGAAPEIARLLEHCPDLTILATSRQALRLRSEREYPVSPLALPDLEQLPPYEQLGRIPAVELFVHRAESARPSFALNAANAEIIAGITVRLDGLPLAIELAAARIRVLSPADLLARLQQRLPLLTGGAADLPVRQQTLRATIDWSYELLNRAEQHMFRQLSVFVGGFALEAAESVTTWSADIAGDLSRLDTLTSLVDKSFVRAVEIPGNEPGAEDVRFTMLETIREYGLERLAGEGDERATRERHTNWCATLAERAEPQLTGADQDIWTARLEREQDNIRSALTWAIDHSEADAAQRMCGTLYRFWAGASLFAEGRGWTERALDIQPAAPSIPRAKSLLGAGVLSYFMGDYRAAESFTSQARDSFQALNDQRGIAYANGNIGLFADVNEEYDKAITHYSLALDVFRKLGDLPHIGFMLGNLGLINYFQGNYQQAKALMEESLENSRTRGDRDSTAITLANLGLVALAQGNVDQAEQLLRETIRLRKVVSNKSHLARSIESLASVAAARRQFTRAACLLGAGDGLRSEIGAPLPPKDHADLLNTINHVQGRLEPAEFDAAWETGATMTSDEAIEFALGSTYEPAMHGPFA